MTILTVLREKRRGRVSSRLRIGAEQARYAAMAVNVQVSCIRKRDRQNPHERIEGLGGMHLGQRWYLEEEVIIAELEKPESVRQWNFYTLVDGKTAWVVVAVHNGRKYLRTTADTTTRNHLLSLPECPR